MPRSLGSPPVLVWCRSAFRRPGPAGWAGSAGAENTVRFKESGVADLCLRFQKVGDEVLMTRSKLVRLVATDLDGTLLRGDGACSGRTRAALAAVERAGVQVVLVTARPPRWLHGVADLVGAHGLALCCNGAFVYDVRSRQVLDEHSFASKDIADIAADLRNGLPGIVFAVENRVGFRRERDYRDEFTTPQDVSAATLEELLDPLPGKVLARCQEVSAVRLHQVVDEIVGDRAVVSYSGASGLAEIGAAGVTKAAALGQWCAAQGIESAEVFAFGDMPNDVPMLRWAGRSFGVANAHSDVLDVVDQVCPSNEQDGVAQVLETLLADIAAGTMHVAAAGGSASAAAYLRC